MFEDQVLRLFKLIFWILGVALLIWAIQRVNLKDVTHLILEMKWGLALVLSVYTLINLADAASWKYAFKPIDAQPMTVGSLWKIRQIGEAFNMVTPLGTMGGEPLKAQLVKESFGLSLKNGVASLVVARTTNLLGLILFLIIGVFLIFPSESVASDFKKTAVFSLFIFSSLIFLFLLFQIKGGLKMLTLWASGLPFGESIQHLLEQLENLSHQMMDYYRENRNRCLKSIWYSFVGWVLGIAELYGTFYFLGKTLSFTDIWIIEALVQLIKVASFFIPLSIGALEGGSVLIFAALGMPANLALAVSFVRRVKELTWITLGLAMSGTMYKPSKAESDG